MLNPIDDASFHDSTGLLGSHSAGERHKDTRTRSAESLSSIHTGNTTAEPRTVPSLVSLGDTHHEDRLVSWNDRNDHFLHDHFEAELPLSMSTMQDLQISYTSTPNTRDPIDGLSDGLTVMRSFIVSLQTLDNKVISGSPVAPIYLGLEASIQAHLQRLIESERKREEQSRELVGLARVMESLNWDGVELDLVLGRGLGLGMFDSFDEIDDERETWGVGWAGPDTIDVNQNLDPDASLVSLVSLDPNMSTTSTRPPSPLPQLRQATIDTILTTQTLITSLSALAESLESISSFSSATTRQLRGIRAGVESWKERDAQEARSRRQIEDWESRRVTLGLRGCRVSDVLSREVGEFECALDDWGGKMRKMRTGHVS